jgi:hypothetical protein
MECLSIPQEKVCFKCKKLKPIEDFYKHGKTGRVNKCKDCTKTDVTEYRNNNIDKVRAYDRERGKLPHRIEQNTKRTAEYRSANPEKYKAHCAVNNALRDGRIERKPCAVCGETESLEAHHFDYRKPLEVIWLCSVHHTAVHMGFGYS